MKKNNKVEVFENDIMHFIMGHMQTDAVWIFVVSV